MANDKKLTVLQVLPALESGGVERGTLEVGKYLVEHGHRSIVMSAGGRLVEQLLREGSEHVTWDIGAKRLSTLRLVLRLRRFLVENQVDILHVRSRMPGWVCYMAWKGMDSATRPHLVTTVHGLYSVNPYSAIMTRGECVIAVSKTVRDYIVKNYRDVNADGIITIPRGIGRNEFPYGYRPNEKWLNAWYTNQPHLQEKKIITLPGRITRLKGHKDFLHLIRQLRERDLPVHGLIVGGAEASKQAYLKELKEYVVSLSLQHDITFTGQRHDLREIMSISDMVLSLSTQPESFGRTVLEALSLGIPVAGYDHGGVGEILREIFPQGLVKLRDQTALIELIERWLNLPPRVPQDHDFTLKSMLQKTLSTYQQLVHPE